MKPIASLSLDLDNKWSYLKTHGDSGWESYPSYFDVAVPRILRFLKERSLVITFFVVGQDATLEANREALASIAAAGHEIGNHSFRHEPWLHRYSEAQLEEEIASAEEHIERATGQHPQGFRGPGFSLSQATLDVLARRGYRYDASTLPTFIGPLARAYYLRTAKLSAQDRHARDALFGKFSEGFRPLSPYRWRTTAGSLLEIPVTTMPFFRVPMHASYVLYLGAVAPRLAVPYFEAALALCRLTRTQPSLLLHPLDFLGRDDAPDLSFFPSMNVDAESKLSLLSDVLGAYARHWDVVTMRRHAETVTRRDDLPVADFGMPQPG